MSKIAESALDLIGNTPLLKLNRYSAEAGVTILGKLEYLNPAGSVKDRIALAMIEDAEKKGILKPGATIIEPTSGNTGIGLAAVAAAKGYHAILTLPDTMSVERRNLLAAYGAELVLTEGAKGMKGAIAKAEELKESTPGAVILGQFVNPANPAAHKATTGPEIWEATEGKVDYLVLLAGTGGSIVGIGKYLKEKNPDLKIIGVQPAKDSLKDPNFPERNTIDGVLVFDNVPKEKEILYFKEFGVSYDECLEVSADDAYETGRQLVKSDGIFLGQSAAAAVYASSLVAKRPEAEGKTIVAICADNAFKYLSTNIYR